jgi:hypothetical protein
MTTKQFWKRVKNINDVKDLADVEVYFLLKELDRLINYSTLTSNKTMVNQLKRALKDFIKAIGKEKCGNIFMDFTTGKRKV